MAQSLTEKQRRFVDAYLKNPNATEAAKAAGYSEKTARSQGQRLLTNVDIAEHLKKRREKVEEATGVTAAMVIEGLLTEARYNAEGASHSARVTAWKALGEHVGLFLDKSDKSAVQVNVNVRRMPRGKRSS